MNHTRFGLLGQSICSDGLYKVHPTLVQDYVEELHAIGRYDDACQNVCPSSTGGVDVERTYNAFVDRFCASVCRSAYLVLNSNGRLSPVSDELLSRLADGRLAILDIPCGSGAGLLGLLSIIASLRENGSLPRLPLTIEVTAGDFSESARALYERLMQRAKPWLEHEGIRIRWMTFHWDASDQFSTSAIVDQWLDNSRGSEEFVVFVAAFSDAAANNFSKFERTFAHITERTHNRSNLFVWLEPDWKKTPKFFEALEKHFAKIANLFRGTKRLSDSFRWLHPLNANKCDGKIMVVRHESLKGRP